MQPLCHLPSSTAQRLKRSGFSGYLDMIQLQVDRGQGYTDLTYDTTPGYTDTQPFPATLTTWKYRAIYRVGDDQVGLWSAEVGIAIGGS